MTLTTKISVGLTAHLVGVADFANPVFDLPHAAAIALASGVASGQADLIFADQRSVAASTNDDLDLSGSLTTPLKDPCVFVKVKAIYIRAADANAQNLTIGNGSNPFVGPFGAGTHTLQLQPGGAITLVAPKTGWPVTASTADILRIANGAGSTCTYDIVIIGTSA